METLCETVTGGMLREKRKCLEVELKVPDEEKLLGEGWVASFCKTYKIQEHRCHGESGSVDLEAVEAKWKQCQKILAAYASQDRWNFDETALFPLYVTNICQAYKSQIKSQRTS